MGSDDQVFSTLAEAQDECHKLPQRPESAANQSKIFFLGYKVKNGWFRSL